MLANMVEDRSLREVPATLRWSLFALVALATALLMRKWRPLASAAIAGGMSAGVAALAAYLFAIDGWWLPAANAMLVPVLAYTAQGGRAYVEERARRREIRRAFEHYVSPAVVEQIVAHPERLRLGGERSELTILFTDLAGFTHLAETLPSEEVAGILNRHLSDLTEIVIRHGGTVDKFIGDSVMAFWGAPIADPDQSAHALAAAMDMQRATEHLRDDVAGRTGADLRIRIGLHRGECVVGNMGGEKRFSYTAVGDSVNLAARLEGVNKVYGTTILLSGEVASAIPQRARALRLVDTVRVVGRARATEIYTPCNDDALRSRSAAALDAYRRGDRAAATAAWSDLSADYPSDGVASVFLQRLRRWDIEGLPDGWQGVTTMENK
jgi:adenylate cyclase